MKRLIVLLPLFAYLACMAQSYEYLGTVDGLNDRRVYSITEDPKEHLWFLNNNGVDSYDGKTFKHYKTIANGKTISYSSPLSQLHIDSKGSVWLAGETGQIFRYNYLLDCYQLMAEIPQKESSSFNCSYLDKQGNIWMCSSDNQYIYHTPTKKLIQIRSNRSESINAIVQTAPNNYYISTSFGIYQASLQNNFLRMVACPNLNFSLATIELLFYHSATNKLILCSYSKGIYVYDILHNKINQPRTNLNGIKIIRIRKFKDCHLLIATDGACIYNMDISACTIEPFVVADYTQPNKMNGNHINDVLVDKNSRIWVANYPIGITVVNNEQTEYSWIKHSVGNPKSLVSNQVNCIIEDAEGDIWYATNNGISLHKTKTNEWINILSSVHQDNQPKGRVFNTICEVSPGTLLASGHYAILYKIDKKSMNATPISYKTCHLYSSKLNEEISTLHKDTQGDIWMGGNRYMGKLNLRTSCVEAYPGINYINTIIDKDKSHLWIGTNHGIYVFNKNEGRFVKLTLPTPSASINTIYQSNHHLLYIGTTNSGLFIYNPTKKSFKHYHQDNSGLSSNCIYHFIPFGSRDLIISTQNSIALFSVGSQTFSSWTNKEGLPNIHFLPTSGTHTQQNSFVVGSEDGAIEFKHIKLPKNRKQALIFRDFKILYKEMDSNDEGSPLINDVNRTGTLKLKNSQNSFSMQVSAFYYAFSHRYHYRWKLYGYDESYITSDRNIIQYENIPTGHYKLIVEAISKETRQVVEKKEVSILILPSFWYSYKGITLCLLILGLVSLMTYYIYIQKKQIEKATEKIDFFVNTVHDIRTPLTLIKAPLEEFISRRSRTKKEENDLSIAVKNTNYLCKLISGISNFETEKISPRINMAEHELYSFLEEKVKQFDSLSTHKHINLSFRSNFRYLNVWFDIDKMESIIVNLLSNAIKYTTSYGTVEVIATQEQYCWKIEVKDSGIGIPNSEQNKLFKTFFRGKNAVQSQEPGSGMGLMMTGKLIHQQKGTIKINSIEGKGSSFEISFPFNSKQLEKNKGKQIKKEENPLIIINAQQACANVAKEKVTNQVEKSLILIVEDDYELTSFLKYSFTNEYIVRTACNGRQAMEILKEIKPALIISDYMMPEMKGDELCTILKKDKRTTDIPIIMLTGCDETYEIFQSLNTVVDMFITKPFDIKLLRARIRYLLTNKKTVKEEVIKETSTEDKFILNIKIIIKQNIAEPNYNVTDICKTLNISRTSLYTKIKKSTGLSPNDFIRSQHLNYAAQLLKQHQYTVSEVIDLSGFNDPKYFREMFKKQFGVNPSVYMKEETK